MAKFQVEIPDDFARQIEKLEDTDALQEYLLNESSKPLEDAVIRNLQKHKKSGSLAKSVKKIVKKNKWGWFLVVRPVGKDKKGKRNMEKLMHIEFGTKRQPPRPLLSKAVREAEPEVLKIMERKLNEYVSK